MTSLAVRTAAIPKRRADAPWPGYEYARGWGIFGLPFDSGHVLAVRVFPENSFAPYRAVWHRDPGGRWSIFTDATRPDVACPRYFGPACEQVGKARIVIDWTGPRTVHVRVDEPHLEWSVTVARSPVLALLNPISAAMPLWSWRPEALVSSRELLARALGMGHLALRGEMPSGHRGLLMPERMYLVQRSEATLDGAVLGHATRLQRNPTIGDVPLPARGVLAIGQGMWAIRDREEFERTRNEITVPTTPKESAS